ncbi:hypothetical protein ABZ816_35065 [Actinosynnema sp. NPDC047251]|uniref:Secreted protein n=1 Tax=Saccharothrix espanaensis (strain ATCC 51144 / DSM 44229 / JCM 9112 / NBRC 15066 / NRRL 15764) TaxID=1179773 RepID=K0JUY3_SACES|nr:hypothetical protein [Saccharothrix espanaensis]CCH28574.1 hypothetical protein BN6_12480 [Saccharothrix espanaensis DSM 44229]
MSSTHRVTAWFAAALAVLALVCTGAVANASARTSMGDPFDWSATFDWAYNSPTWTASTNGYTAVSVVVGHRVNDNSCASFTIRLEKQTIGGWLDQGTRAADCPRPNYPVWNTTPGTYRFRAEVTSPGTGNVQASGRVYYS